ncbi:type I-E CRISPR-associated protein Cas6/Cse3/CasE [Virgisporangium aliadipatigenens]|uniref:Type I-E CRISPR-associated protein Cas6/Cse3/CasE n=1 Tax=Virgisporangium aliadipatigenens TaxID=741659 RepID=A0A8J3YYR3_9ACTN|nr:type I-E CRISPR-associated protein Cas6/Cse3/CasE [Virgisporangium aliadipatigenens]GIJ52215.1 type I-E CRISPR-associated protein Cas6/Cse3/CasE [Virgisporangium aliadipatigenens]
MFLTRFTVDPNRRGARKLLASPQAMHAAVRAAFTTPEDHDRPGARTLWRLDATTAETLYLYIVSPGQPDLAHLVTQAGHTSGEAWATRPYQGLLDSLKPGQRWAFRLTANPAHSGRKTAEAKETQRFGLLRPAEQQQWLADRAERCGFALAPQTDGQPNLTVHRRQTLSFRRGAGTVTLTVATFDGILDITDAQAFRKTLTAGIGHAKAYGCGLLTIAPTR